MSEVEKFIQTLKGIRHIAINTCHGGFGLSDRAIKEYCNLTGINEKDFNEYDLDRDDPYLIKVIKDLGIAANGAYANLKVVEVPGDVDWQIEEYDGREWISEVHRTWD